MFLIPPFSGIFISFGINSSLFDIIPEFRIRYEPEMTMQITDIFWPITVKFRSIFQRDIDICLKMNEVRHNE